MGMRARLVTVVLLAMAVLAPGMPAPHGSGPAGLARAQPQADAKRLVRPPAPGDPGAVDRIVVEKARRVMRLERQGRTVASYRIALGGNPVGHKQREGDRRTPEGSYRIVRHNPDSAFHLSLGISYPAPADIMAAEARGERPGGLIMIHGQPDPKPGRRALPKNGDWTDGCIAVANREIEEIYARVPVGTPIDIRP